MTKPEFDEMAALVVRLRKDVELNTDALKQSNAQCAEYLRQNEKLRAELETARVAAASLERIQATAAKWGASGQEDAGHFIERTATDLEFVHLQLVDVRAALASVTEQRDSLRRTLAEWERADTKPHERVTADDVADHVVPPVLPLCNVCHECRGPLICGTVVGSPSVLHCRNERCLRRNTAWRDDVSPYYGPCKSTTPVRHE